MMELQTQPTVPGKANQRTASAKRFRYSYLYRLIDDREIADLPRSTRAELRRAHKQAYWKNVSLLRRDASLVLKARRTRMGAEQDWDFNSLVGDYARVQMLLATLTLAGLSHTSRVPVLLEQVRTVCTEFETMFTASPALVAA